MILRAIENIRQKPKAVRQRYAFVTAATFTAIVTGIWVISLPARFDAVQNGMLTASPEISTQSAGAPFSGVWGEFKQQILDMTGRGSVTNGAVEKEQADVSTPIVEESFATTSNSVLLESGSTITFGTSNSASSTKTIMLGTTSTTSSTSPDGL